MQYYEFRAPRHLSVFLTLFPFSDPELTKAHAWVFASLEDTRTIRLFFFPSFPRLRESGSLHRRWWTIPRLFSFLFGVEASDPVWHLKSFSVVFSTLASWRPKVGSARHDLLLRGDVALNLALDSASI